MTRRNIKRAAASVIVLVIFAGAAVGQDSGKAIPQPAATDEELDAAAETAGKLRDALAELAANN